MSTPLEKLDDAIHEYVESLSDKDKTITGWVLGIATSRLDPSYDGSALPTLTGAQYSIGPQTSVTHAGGLVQFLSVAIEKATWQMLNDGDVE